MVVIKEYFFHISRDDKWEVGDLISAGIKENPFWLACKNYSPQISLNGEVMSIFAMIDQNPNFTVTKSNIDFLYQNLKNVCKETAFYIREQVFEDVRKELYPQLPSRKKCLWICKENELSYWKTLGGTEKRYLLTLEVTGEVFCGDDTWLTADSLSSVVYSERANRYWAGELGTTPRKEYLFYGQAVVKEISSFQ